jgi:hypothetical protein
MTGQLNRQDRPPKSGPDLWIRRLKKKQWVIVTILCDSIWGVYVHWNGSKTEPCFEDKKKCPGHARQLPLRWKGYLHVWDHERKEECFLELTPLSAEQLLEQLGQLCGMRGSRCRVERMDGDKARLRVTLLGAGDHHGELPAEKSPLPTLSKLWGIAPGKHLSGGQTGIPADNLI